MLLKTLSAYSTGRPRFPKAVRTVDTTYSQSSPLLSSKNCTTTHGTFGLGQEARLGVAIAQQDVVKLTIAHLACGHARLHRYSLVRMLEAAGQRFGTYRVRLNGWCLHEARNTQRRWVASGLQYVEKTQGPSTSVEDGPTHAERAYPDAACADANRTQATVRHPCMWGSVRNGSSLCPFHQAETLIIHTCRRACSLMPLRCPSRIATSRAHQGRPR